MSTQARFILIYGAKNQPVEKMTNTKYGVGLWPELPPSPPGGSAMLARGRQHAACVSQTAPVSQAELTLGWVETD